MNNKEIKKLLDTGIITEGEYRKIIERLEEYRTNNVKSCSNVLREYKDYILSEKRYSRATAYETLKVAKQYVEFVLTNNRMPMGEAFSEKYFNTESMEQFILVSLGNKETSTVASLLIRLKVFLTYMNDNHSTKFDIDRIIYFSKMVNKKMNFDKTVRAMNAERFSKEEIYTMVNLCEDSHKLVVLLCYEACMSRDELANAQFTDIDFKKEMIYVKDPNTGSVEREMELPHDLCLMLSAYRKDLIALNRKYNVNRLKKGKPERPFSEYIFQSKKSNTSTPTTISNRIREVDKKWCEYKYEECKDSVSYEEFKENYKKIDIPTISFSKIYNMLIEGEWTADDVVNKYKISSIYYLEQKMNRSMFVDY